MNKFRLKSKDITRSKLIGSYKDQIHVYGKTQEFLNGDLISEGYNTINEAVLLGYIADCFDSSIDKAIDSLFTTNDPNAPGGTDGIVIQIDDPTNTIWRPMVTTPETPTNTYAKKWRGIWTHSGADILIEELHLGHGASFPAGSDSSFDTEFAEKVRSTPLPVTTGEVYEFVWELFFAPA